ncbi:MAG: two-component regulator propeller domain-containing protein [Niabella sp.]
MFIDIFRSIRRMILLLLLFINICAVQANEFVFTSINVSHGLSDNQIRYMLQLPDGRMVFTTSGNLNLYDGAHFKYLHRTPQHISPLPKYDGFYRVYQNGDSLLWIKDYKKIMCVNLYQEKYIPNLRSYLKQKKIPQPVDDLFVDTEDRLWVLTSGGLWNQNMPGIIDISNNQGNLQDLVADKKYLYLFYSTGEIICYDLITKNKLYVKSAYTLEEQSLFKNTSLVVKGNDGFYQLRNGSKGGFFFFDPQKRAWEKILETSYVLNTLIVTPDETAYISCTNGFWVINRRTGYRQYLPLLKTVDGDIIDTEISTLFYDKQGGLWVGTLNRGLLYYHPSRYKFSYIGRSYFPETSTKDIIIQSFAEDQAGNLYIKSPSAIYQYRYSAENHKFLQPVSSFSLPKEILTALNKSYENTFGGYRYTAVCKDSRGWVWAGTQDGLKLIKPESEKERTFYTEDGLVNNFIHAILEDRAHNIWVTTSYGISKILVDSLSGAPHFVNFNVFDGTLKGAYTDGAIFEMKNGTLCFGGINGFNMLKPEHLTATKLSFKPILTNLLLRGEKIEVGNIYDGRMILSQTPPYTKSLELSYNQNFLTLVLSALNYQNPSQTSYRYKLEGIDKDWQETAPAGKNGSVEDNGLLRISYTNLPPGTYILKVMASGNALFMDESPFELGIVIKAPWWRTTTAYILYVLLFAAAIFLSIYLYIYFTRKKLERNHKEEILLLRIRNLIEQCNMLEAEKESYFMKTDTTAGVTENISQPEDSDSVFLARAIELVEKNLDEPGYSVEQLSRDLYMDRTGLYRKLVALLDKSPSLFIRSIRLQKAAQLILEGQFSITEIADRVGFSTTSYMSKCFQEMYGCRPSEYAEKVRKST